MPSEPVPSRLVASSAGAWIWLADLDDPVRDLQAAAALLSDDERERAGRFVFDAHRERFVVCRAWLRSLLAGRLGCAPRDLRFEYGSSGKPALAGPGPRFNVSHSDRYALIGVAESGDIGVDIERVRPLRDMDLVAERVFSAAERDALTSVPEGQRVEAFFAGWTRKEAYIKAKGEGIHLLGAIEVTLVPGAPPRLMRAPGSADELDRWSIQAFSPVAGFVAAACVEGGGRPWDAV